MSKTIISLIVVGLSLPLLSIVPVHAETCPIDTTTDKDTGRQRDKGTGVEVCGDKDGGSIGFSTTGEELDNFRKYPLGKSDKGAVKQIFKYPLGKSDKSVLKQIFGKW
jgi:hypothetical protein